MTSLTAGDYLAIAGLLSAFVGLPATIILVMLRRVETGAASFRAEIRSHLQRLDDRVGELESGKVSHLDWVRVTTSHLNRLNALSTQMAELCGKIDGSLGMGAGVMRIARALERGAAGTARQDDDHE